MGHPMGGWEMLRAMRREGDLAGRKIRTLSGGMRRRVGIAQAIVADPQLLLLDEPTTGLDPEARATMWEEIARLAGAEGLTILLTTHYWRRPTAWPTAWPLWTKVGWWRRGRRTS